MKEENITTVCDITGLTAGLKKTRRKDVSPMCFACQGTGSDGMPCLRGGKPVQVRQSFDAPGLNPNKDVKELCSKFVPEDKNA